MKVIQTILTVIGAAVVILWVAGTMGIGNFKLYYGPEKIACIKESK